MDWEEVGDHASGKTDISSILCRKYRFTRTMHDFLEKHFPNELNYEERDNLVRALRSMAFDVEI